MYRLLQAMLDEKMKEFENMEAELRRQIEDLQKKHNEARAEIDEYQRRYVGQSSLGYVPLSA